MRWREKSGAWLLHAAVAYSYRGEIGEPYAWTPGLRGYRALMEVDRSARLANQQRLRALARTYGEEVRIFCAHDAVELALLAGS